MTRGIISAIRSVRGPTGSAIEDAIQTDAAINPVTRRPLMNSTVRYRHQHHDRLDNGVDRVQESASQFRSHGEAMLEIMPSTAVSVDRRLPFCRVGFESHLRLRSRLDRERCGLQR